LPREEQLRPIATVAQGLNLDQAPGNGTPWREDIAASAAQPLRGQDAQEWVTRTRQESDGTRGAP